MAHPAHQISSQVEPEGEGTPVGLGWLRGGSAQRRRKVKGYDPSPKRFCSIPYRTYCPPRAGGPLARMRLGFLPNSDPRRRYLPALTVPRVLLNISATVQRPPLASQVPHTHARRHRHSCGNSHELQKILTCSKSKLPYETGILDEQRRKEHGTNLVDSGGANSRIVGQVDNARI